MANVLRDQGVKKGDRVCIYLPMIPELVFTVLACARIGAIHSVIFAGFSANALSTRINDCNAKVIITADGGYRGSKTVDLKKIVDDALNKTNTIEKVLLVKRTNQEIDFKEGRDIWLQPLLEQAETTSKAEVMDAEDPLFILYTSGSTANQKVCAYNRRIYGICCIYI